MTSYLFNNPLNFVDGKIFHPYNVYKHFQGLCYFSRRFSMAKARHVWFISDWARNKALNAPIQPYTFKEHELVSEPIQFSMPCYGAYLRVPANTEIALFSPNGQIQMYQQGGMLFLERAKYLIRYVNKQQHTDTFWRIETEALDSWKVSISLDVTWEIKDTNKIVKMKDPFHRLESLCRDAAMHFIQKNTFDSLIPNPHNNNNPPITETEITQSILQIIEKNPALEAFHIIQINLKDRHGDPRIKERIQDGLVEQTSEIQSLRNQVERLKMQLQVSQEEKKLLQEREGVLVQQAHIERKVEEEQLQLTLTRAQLEARIAEIMRPVYEQTIALEQLKNTQQFDRDQVMTARRLYVTAFQSFAQVIAQAQLTPGLQQSLENSKAFDQFQKAFSSLSGLPNLDQEEEGVDKKSSTSRILPVIDLDDLGE
jgi:hypothetical protein